MANLADLTVHIGADTSDLESSLGNASSFIDDNIGKITALGAVAGAAFEGFARSQQDANVAFERMGRVTGEGSAAMRDMAGDLQNVTFPMSDVVDLMETASQRGLKGDAIAEYAKFWDMVGDATGEAGPALGEAGVALGLVGIAAGEEAKALDAFGFITDNTTGSIEGFLGFIEKTAGELGDATPNINDMAGALGALEDAGYSSQRAQRELRTALNETDGDMVAALETLGVSEESFRAQVEAVDASSGSIQANAQAYAESFTPMQKMQAQAEKLMTKYGGLADAAGMLAVPLLALGPVMKGVSGIFKVASSEKVAAMAATTAATVKNTAIMVAKWAWTGVQALIHAAKIAAAWLLSVAPIAIVIAAVVGLVVLIVKNWDKIKEVIGAGWAWVKEKTAALWGWIKDTTKATVDAVVGFFTGLRDRAVEKVTSLRDQAVARVTDLRDRVVGFFSGLRDTVVGIATGIRDRVIGFFGGLKDGAIEKIRALIDRVRDIKGDVLGFFAGAGRWLLDAGKNIVQGLIDGIGSMVRALGDKVSSVVSSITDRLPWSPAKKGPLRTHPPEKGGANIIRQLAEGMGGEVGTLAAMADRAAAAALPRMGGVTVPGVAPMAAGGDGASAGPQRFVLVLDDGTELGGYVRRQSEEMFAESRRVARAR